MDHFQGITEIELGCGSNKRNGFFGIDIMPSPAVDLVMDYERNPLPFPDNSIDYVYSSHSFEHITGYHHVLQELMRVCKDGATIEIWTPYGKSDDGMLFGHHTFFSEASFKHICFEYDRFFFGDANGYLSWFKTHYNLHPTIIDNLQKMNIPLDFALGHMFNIAMEWGVFMHVVKNVAKAPGPQYPRKVYSIASRQNEVEF